MLVAIGFRSKVNWAEAGKAVYSQYLATRRPQRRCISQQALVRLVDCDSFQVIANGKAFLCEGYVDEYLSPELQGLSLSGLTRTENHDRFGLAVLIYQLLFVGRHPYQGNDSRSVDSI